MLPSGYPGVVKFTESAKAVRSVQNYEDMWSAVNVQNRSVSERKTWSTCYNGTNKGLESLILINLLHMSQRLAFYTVVSKYR